MKTIIMITGQLGSLYAIRNSFRNYDELITGHFNHYVHLVYNTREKAIEAIANAQNHLLSEDCELRNISETGFCYDAGSAEIYNETI